MQSMVRSARRSAPDALAYLLTTAAALAVMAAAARAQSAAPETELSPIVVQGATLDKPRQRRATPTDGEGSQPAAQSAPSSTSEPSADASQVVAPGDIVTGVPEDELGASVSVVTRAQLEARQVRTGADAIRSLPGVSVSRTAGVGSLTQVRIRGAEGNHTLVLIDGVEANDTTNGEFDFADLSADDIEQIEVIRGSYSGIYGSGAVGGVINIVTRGGRGPLTIAGYAEGGSFETKGGNVRVSGGNDKIWGAASLSKRKTDGFNIAPFGSEEDGAELATLNIRGGVQILRGLTLDLSLRRTNNEGDRDTQDPFPSITGIQFDDPATFESTTWLGAAKLTWIAPDGSFEQSVKATRNETDRADDDITNQFFTSNLGERFTYAYSATVRTPERLFLDSQHALTGLIEREEEFFTANSSGGFVPPIGIGDEQERNRNAYVGEYRTDFSERLFVTGALRYDDNSVFENFTTWRTSATLKVPELGLRPHSSVGTAVKFPTMFEQFGIIPGFFLPNPDLLPEESFGWDAGVEFSILSGRALIDITYFEADLENEIRGVGFPTRPINLDGESKRDGIEVAARILVTPELSVGASYTYLDSDDPDGTEEIRRAPHSGRVDANYAFARGLGNVNVAAIYNGEMKDTNFGPFPSTLVTLDEYWLVTAAASYEVKPGVELFGRVENALNENYQEVFGFETAGAAAYAGLKFKYVEEASRAWAEGQ